jgi:hypothetical protein
MREASYDRMRRTLAAALAELELPEGVDDVPEEE